MIDKLIDEICKALDAELYLVALNSALILPDICGKAEYPKDKTGARYKQWYFKYVQDGSLPADVMYQLRCSLLHQGDVEPDLKKGVKFNLKTNAFTKTWGLDFCFDSSVTHADGTTERIYTVYVGFLCMAICKAAREYYQNNKDKFDFLNLNITDIKTVFGL